MLRGGIFSPIVRMVASSKANLFASAAEAGYRQHALLDPLDLDLLPLAEANDIPVFGTPLPDHQVIDNLQYYASAVEERLFEGVPLTVLREDDRVRIELSPPQARVIVTGARSYLASLRP